MDPKEAEAVLRHSRGYAARGLISERALAAIEAECLAALGKAPPPSAAERAPAGRAPAPLEEAKEATMASQVLHALGGALLGAAGVALVLLLDMGRSRGDALDGTILGFLGVLGIGAGLGFLSMGRNRDLADVGLLAGLVCLTVAPFPDRGVGRWVSVLGLLAAVAVPILRRGALVAAVCSLSFAVLLFAFIERTFGEPSFIFSHIPDGAVSLWFALACTHLACTLAAATTLRWTWLKPSLGIGAFTIAGPALAFAFSVIAPEKGSSAFFEDYGGGEILLALLEAALLALAIRARQPDLLVGSAAVISLDAIVFAFHVGGIGFGVVSLLAVAAAILATANLLRKRWRRGAAQSPA